MEKQKHDTRRSKTLIRRHPFFPVLVAMWFGAFFGLGTLAVGPAVLYSLVHATRIDLLIPVAGHSLPLMARLAIAFLFAAIGVLTGAALGRRIAATPVHKRQRSRTGRENTGEPLAPRRSPHASVPTADDMQPSSRRRLVSQSYENVSNEPIATIADIASAPVAMSEATQSEIAEWADDSHAVDSRAAEAFCDEPTDALIEHVDGFDASLPEAPVEAEQPAPAVPMEYEPTVEYAEPEPEPAAFAPLEPETYAAYEPETDEGDSAYDADEASSPPSYEPDYDIPLSPESAPSRAFDDPASAAPDSPISPRQDQSAIDSLSPDELMERLTQSIERRRSTPAATASSSPLLARQSTAISATEQPQPLFSRGRGGAVEAPSALRPIDFGGNNEADIDEDGGVASFLPPRTPLAPIIETDSSPLENPVEDDVFATDDADEWASEQSLQPGSFEGTPELDDGSGWEDAEGDENDEAEDGRFTLSSHVHDDIREEVEEGEGKSKSYGSLLGRSRPATARLPIIQLSEEDKDDMERMAAAALGLTAPADAIPQFTSSAPGAAYLDDGSNAESGFGEYRFDEHRGFATGRSETPIATAQPRRFDAPESMANYTADGAETAPHDAEMDARYDHITTEETLRAALASLHRANRGG